MSDEQEQLTEDEQLAVDVAAFVAAKIIGVTWELLETGEPTVEDIGDRVVAETEELANPIYGDGYRDWVSRRVSALLRELCHLPPVN